MERLEPLLEAALHELPKTARHHRPSPLGVVEVRIEVAEPELPVVADLRGREAVEISVPRKRREAEAEETEAEPGSATRDETHPPLPRLDRDVAEHERSTARASAPQYRFTITVCLERVPHGAAGQLVVDGVRESHRCR